MPREAGGAETKSSRSSSSAGAAAAGVLSLLLLFTLRLGTRRPRRPAREAKEQIAAAEATAKADGAPSPTPPDVASNTRSEGINGGSNPRGARRAAFARRREQGGRIFRETLADGDDRIEIDSRLTETGARVRIRLEEGFVKIFGRLLASRIAPAEEIEEKVR